MGSTNPVKIRATREAFERHFSRVRVEGHPVPSGVSPQPVGVETLQGARNRVRSLRSLPDALQVDFFVGIEGGIGEVLGCWMAFGVVVVEDRQGRQGVGFSPMFPLPREWIRRLQRGEELGTLVDEAAGRTRTKHDLGAIGYLSRGDMDRTELYLHGIRAALVPFLRPHWTFTCSFPQGEAH